MPPAEGSKKHYWHEDWTCGDCGTKYPPTVGYCTRPFDDYLALHGGSIEAAILAAGQKATHGLVRDAMERLQPPPLLTLWSAWGRKYKALPYDSQYTCAV